eukprot:1178278-Prorocentrum_minimum.AAC.1
MAATIDAEYQFPTCEGAPRSGEGVAQMRKEGFELATVCVDLASEYSKPHTVGCEELRRHRVFAKLIQFGNLKNMSLVSDTQDVSHRVVVLAHGLGNPESGRFAAKIAAQLGHV